MKMFSKISKISVDKYTSMTYNKIIKGKDGTAGKVQNMYRVEFGFGENNIAVEEWETMDGLEIMEAESAEEAAKEAACTDGLENAIFRVYELVKNEFGEWEPKNQHNPEYFCFC